jgi:outer membrane protein assembly factor BamB
MYPALLVSLVLSGCSSLDALNPFSGGSKPKMAELAAFEERVVLRSLWRYDIGKAGDAVFYPAIVKGAVFVAAADGSLARLEDGAEKWRIKTGKPLSAGVSSDGERVIVGTWQGDVLAYAARDGAFLWAARVSSEVLAPPLIEAGMVIVKSGDHRIEALDLEGRRKWFYQRPSPPLSLRDTSPLVFAEQFILTGFPGGKLLALSVQNGAPVWEGTVAVPRGATELERVADIVSPPTLSGTTGCAVAYQGRLTCFDFSRSGQPLWYKDVSSSVGLMTDGNNVYVTDDEDAVSAFTLASGSSHWKTRAFFLRGMTAPLVTGQGYLALGDKEGYVHLLSSADGSSAGRIRVENSPILIMPQRLSGNRLLIQTRSGRVEALAIEPR